MKKKRIRYTQEFKEESVKLITEQGYQIAEAARNLGVNQTMLGRWKREVEGGPGDVVGSQGTQALQAELARLRKMISNRFWGGGIRLRKRCVTPLFLIQKRPQNLHPP